MGRVSKVEGQDNATVDQTERKLLMKKSVFWSRQSELLRRPQQDP